MLGKVMKYELRASGRDLLPFFGLALAGSGVIRFLLWLAPRLWASAAMLVTSLSGMLGMLLVFAAIAVGFILPVVRFYKSMVTDEGYLSFTLPVTTGTHVAGRTIVGTLYALLGCLVAAACATIIIPGFWGVVVNSTVFSTGVGDGMSLNYALTDLPAGFIWSIVGMVVVFALLAAVTNLVKVYASIAIGPAITRNKLLGSVVGFIIINAAQGILMLLLMLIPAFAIIGGEADALERYLFAMMGADAMANLGSLLGFIWGFIGIVSAVSLAFAAAEYWLTWYFLDRKLNLE